MLTSSPIPDPRQYANDTASPLASRAQTVAASTSDSQSILHALARQISGMLARGDEDAVREALREAPSAQASRALYQALDLALSPGLSRIEEAAAWQVASTCTCSRFPC